MTRAPSCIPLSLPSDAASAIATQLHDERGFIWLDSANSSGQAQGFSLVSCAPSETIAHRPGSASASDFLDNWNQAYLERANQHGSSLPFTGGWLGALYYDFGEELMGIHRNYSESGATAYVAYHPWAIVFDHQGNCSYWVDDGCPLDDFAHALKSALLNQISPYPAPKIGALETLTWSAIETRHDYADKVETILQYLLAGDSYQVNYAQAFETQLEGSAWSRYLALRTKNAAPFSACLLQTSLDDILCFSPELFIRGTDSLLVTQPIKGTTPRHNDPDIDRGLAQALSDSHKNRAENVMIVDLLRNDLGRVCTPGSIRVNSLCELHSYPSVHHLVSEVQGALAKEMTPIDALKATFPGGSITGAPKKRSMEIIRELEGLPRGIYCGSILALSNNGNFTSNIAIRTISIKDGCARVWGGGGIVADSNANDEYQETFDKLSKIL